MLAAVKRVALVEVVAEVSELAPQSSGVVDNPALEILVQVVHKAAVSLDLAASCVEPHSGCRRERNQAPDCPASQCRKRASHYQKASSMPVAAIPLTRPTSTLAHSGMTRS
jgi:hypothetical protein